MLEIGSLVDGKYKILNKIGQGGMSVVYMAINEKANKTWAVKEVRKDGVLDFEAVKQGLVAETDILKKLSHPNLPSIVDVIDTDDSFIIIMDYIEGNSLNDSLEEYGAQPQEYVIEWAKQLCDVLGYLHSRQPAIIYRDMKPSNIMLKPDGNVTLIDFGTAREFKERNFADTTCLGTTGYAAPEQFGGMGQTDARTDIYCLGATLYHLVTGCNPSEPPYEIKPIRTINSSLSSGLEKIIIKCTQRNPDDRYQSAAELMYALDHYNEIDENYRKKQKKKLVNFIVCISLSIVFAISGLTLGLVASGKAEESYERKLNEAKTTSDYPEKIKLYEDCISIPGQNGRSEAYLQLIDTYISDNTKFSVDEAKQIEKLINNNDEELQKNKESYVEICFSLAKLFWYHYDYGESSNGNDNQTIRAKASVEWFERVIENAPDDFKNKGMADVYSEIGNFYSKIGDAVIQAEDKGMYKPFYNNINKLMSTEAVDKNEPDIVRLELLELAISSIKQYATKFKVDGVKEESLNKTVQNVKSIASDNSYDITNETVSKKRNDILSSIDSALLAVKTAYSTETGGN